MLHPHRYLASLFLTAALAAPLSLMAAPQVGVQVRVYDRDHKDYHNWDDHENRAWAQFLVENHRTSHDYKKANHQRAIAILDLAPRASREPLATRPVRGLNGRDALSSCSRPTTAVA